jgi:hypothetical protein
MIAPHKCFLITYLLIAQFVEWIVNLQEIKKTFSKGPNRVGVSLLSHLKTERDPVSKTLCFLVI